MGEIIMRNCDFRECSVGVNWPPLIWQVWVRILQLITPIRGLQNPIKRVVLLISHIRSHPPYRSHLHLPSLPVLSTTLPSLQEHNVHSSCSISPCHDHQLTLSAVYTECSIHPVQHITTTAYTQYSIHLRLSVIPSFSRFRVDPWM